MLPVDLWLAIITFSKISRQDRHDLHNRIFIDHSAVSP